MNFKIKFLCNAYFFFDSHSDTIAVLILKDIIDFI